MKLARIFIAIIAAVAVTLISAGGPGLLTQARGQTVNDRDVLVTLYNSTDGPNWTDNTNWLSSMPLGQWHGVTTDEMGRVTEIFLVSNGLRGEIPSDISGLISLRSLRLTRNWLRGEIPPEIGELDQLQTLHLYENQLNGGIPPEFGNLTNLTELYLGDNLLSGEIPPEFGNLTSLRQLYLSFNSLSGEIPPEIGNLANLRWLELSNSQLRGEIPSEIGSLTNLIRISLQHNQLHGEIPPELGSLSKLEHLHLRDNQLTGVLPESLTGLTELRWFDFMNNSGLCASEDDAFQAWLRKIPNVKGASCALMDPLEESTGSYYTQFTRADGILIKASGAVAPGALESAASILRRMMGHRFDIAERLRENDATLAIIPTNSYITELPEFRYWSGRFTLNDIPYDHFFMRGAGGIASQPTAATSEENLLDLPEDKARLSFLDVTVHEWAHSMENIGFDDETRAEWLDLFHAARGADLFPGTYAMTPGGREFFAVMSDGFFDVSHSYASLRALRSKGPIGIQILEALEDVYGPVDCMIGSAVPDAANNPGLVSDCEALLAARDTLAGTATANLNWAAITPMSQWTGVTVAGTPQRVTRLSLFEGGLAGTIPSRLGDLSNLVRLDLEANQLTGEIPAELGDLSNLERLYLGGNQLTGEIPTELGDLSNLDSLYLGHNQLSGEIPEALGSLSNLGLLHLANNQLTGDIPDVLKSLTGLSSLYLANNQLTGCVPAVWRAVTNNDLDDLGLPYCDVLLSGLTVSPGSLVPAFDPYRTEYSASVGLSPVTVTVSPTNDHNATIRFLDENDRVLADTDRTAAGFQVEFGGTVPAVKVRVTSQDGQATHAYIVIDLGNKYDANDDGAIQRDEVVEAVKDYFSGAITRGEVIEVVKLYFVG